MKLPHFFGVWLFGSDRVEHLICRVARGDVKAFHLLYRKTAPNLFAMILKILPDEEIAAETLGQSFHKIRRYAERYTPGDIDPMVWLFTIARNMAIDRRRSTDLEWTDFEEDGPAIPDDQHIPYDALRHLTVQQRAILLDVYFKGYTIGDLRDATGQSAKAIDEALRKAMFAIVEPPAR